MKARQKKLLAAAVLMAASFSVALPGAPLSAAEPTAFADIPANTWVKVCVSDNTPDWCGMAYDSVRKTVLHWGAGANKGGPAGVQCLDYEAKAWKPDYPSGAAGMVSGDHLVLRWGMKGAEEAQPTLVWDQVCYDPVRKQVVYAGPGAMFAYDPATKKWRDLKASVELYGMKHPGGPPVQWGAMCYDPVNDEIMMFPHAAVYNWDDWEKTGIVGGHMGTFVYSFKDNLWKRLKPAVEPPPRCMSRMAFDEKNKCIVVFGGERQDRLLNDTWSYDCKTRSWKELKPRIAPRPRSQHALVYHQKSGKVLMTGGEGQDGLDQELWALDAAAGEWQRLALAEPPWRTQFNKSRVWEKTRTGWPCYDWACTYDEANDLVVLRFSHQVCDTYVLRPDASKPMEAKSAEPFKEPAREEIPADDPQVISKLKAMPANTWVPAKPPREAECREYGTIAIDQATGWLYYIGGGHSSYTGDDLEVYQPGANRWVRSHPPRHANAMHPFNKNCGHPAGVNFGGGWWTSHLHRYAVHNGTVYVAWDLVSPYVYGPESLRAWAGRYTAKPDDWLGAYYSCARPAPRFLFLYDWKAHQWKLRIPENEKGERLGPEEMAVFGTGAMLDYGKGFFTLSHDRKRFGIYDAETNRLRIGAVGGGAGPGVRAGEGYDFCHLPDREELLVLWSPAKDKPCETWSYSFKNNAWTNLKAANPPPYCEVGRVEYVPEQQVAYAVIKPREGACPQWVYSLKHNAWKEVTAPQVVRSNGPMTQMAYSAKYGVFVWYGWGGTSLMRPDFSQVKWE